MRRLLILIGQWSNICFRSLFARISSCLNYLLTGYMTYQIKHLGRCSYIMKGGIIIGAKFISIGYNTSVGKDACSFY